MNTVKCFLVLALVCSLALVAQAEWRAQDLEQRTDRSWVHKDARSVEMDVHSRDFGTPIQCGDQVSDVVDEQTEYVLYDLVLDAMSSVEINLLFSNADSDLDLYLYMVDEDGPFEIAGSWSVTDNEYISETCLPASSYVIEVYNYGMETAGYSLELGCTACGGGPNPCTPFENMTTITQTGLYPGSNDIDCDSAIDMYGPFASGELAPEVAFEIIVSEPAKLRLALSDYDADLDCFLLFSQNPEDLLYIFRYDDYSDCLVPGTYYALVDGYGAPTSVSDFTLVVEYLPCDYNPCAEQTCTPVEITDDQWSATGNNLFGPVFIDGYAPDVCYSFELQQATALRVNTNLPGTSFDTDLYLFYEHTPCDQEFNPFLHFLAYNDGSYENDYRADTTFSCEAPLPPGVYFLYLTGYFGECGEYEIELDVLECGSAEAEDTPGEFALRQNYPNPFNPSTSIHFSLRETGPASLSIYNLAGQQLAVLVDGMLEAGAHTVNFDAANLSSGVYVYTLQSGSGSLSRKMVLVR